MQIEQDDFVSNQGKSNAPKTATIIAILIGVTVIILMVIIFAMMSMKENKLAVYIDRNLVTVTEDTFKFTDDGKIYISIKDIATLVGYDAHKGEYKIDVEDDSKMYVEAKDGTETTSFFLNSKIISKVKPNTSDDYENITITEPITEMNGKLYIISDGFTSAFNSTFFYNSEKNTIAISTLPSLVEGYSSILSEYRYSKISEDFDNQKALIYGMIVAANDAGRYGVVSTAGNEIISPRYEEIKFIESSEEFIITNSSNKVGIAYSTGRNKISVSYDEIKKIDSAEGLYLVKNEDKYGIINSSENIIVHIEYDQIGVDGANFPADNLKNQYILYETIIPVKLNEKWRLLDTKGNRLTNDEYDSVGFLAKDLKGKVANNALTIGDTNTIIISQDGKYGGVDVKGNILIPIRYEAVYSITSNGITSYYILFNGTEYNAVELINRMKQLIGGYEEIVTPTPTNAPTSASENSNNTNEIKNQETNSIQASTEPQQTTGNGQNNVSDTVE